MKNSLHMAEDFNQTQKNLIENAERAHFYGIRHKGLSGAICENLLLEALRKSIPEFRFDRVLIKFGEKNLVANNLTTENLSSQLDVIVYRGHPLYKIAGNAVIHLSDALGVIEIKKWTYPKSVHELVKSIGNIAAKLQNHGGEQICMFLVTFRFHDRKKDVNWFSETKYLPHFLHAYCFAGGFTSEGQRNRYPWDEAWWDHFDSYAYAGQYQKLVKKIKELSHVRSTR